METLTKFSTSAISKIMTDKLDLLHVASIEDFNILKANHKDHNGLIKIVHAETLGYFGCVINDVIDKINLNEVIIIPFKYVESSDLFNN